MPLEKIISGGQTGADQAGLDAAIEYGFPYGAQIAGHLEQDFVQGGGSEHG